jgi:UDP-glucuronate 4-epimerase
MKVLITGVAGFIGFHLANRLLEDGFTVYGIDNLNDYYDVQLKQSRLAQLQPKLGFTFQHLDMGDRDPMLQLLQEQSFNYVVHLAAQAGVRYSLQNPWAYIDSNITGFINLLEGCCRNPVQHLVFASSSSVYGANTKVPFAVSDSVDHPISLYAASKKANELMAHTYSHLHGLPITGLRFFTVYGPWGRPDMAYYKFVQAIESGQPIDVYNGGKMQRDFTYIDDIIEGVVRVMLRPPQQSLSDISAHSAHPLNSHARYRLYNIGNSRPIELMQFIQALERTLGTSAVINFLPMQPGDVVTTYADVSDLMRDTGFQPTTTIDTGLAKFVHWYRWYQQERASLPSVTYYAGH